MTPRGRFLAALFQNLDERGVEYCVLRNYENLYDDNSSDVDLAIQPEDVSQLEGAMDKTAGASGHRLVQRTRYINHSRVYWHVEGGFLRLDYDAEFRWRIFPVLTAKSVVTLRRKHGDFYVPHPRHESAILFLAAVERGELSERYRQRLTALYEGVSADDLERTFHAAFGDFGEELAAAQSKMRESPPQSSLLLQARRSIIRSCTQEAWKRRELWRNLWTDFGRLVERIKAPAGMSLLYISSAPNQEKLGEVLQDLDPLFPTSKQVVIAERRPRAKDVWQRFRALFKGGLFVRTVKAGRDADLAKMSRKQMPSLFATRAFVWAESTDGRSFLAHAGSGAINDAPHLEITTARQITVVKRPSVVQCISLSLERLLATRRPPQRGALAVLVGLDGSGKTTVAREICALIADSERFRRVRYYHWRPALFGRAELPLPEFREVPRKTKLNENLWQSLLSATRLLKNVLLWKIATYFRVRPFVNKGGLVLVDRYYYNYYLDPVSVKYYGPGWLLDRLSLRFPRPDVVVVLRAPTEVLLARKQELSAEEITRQSAVLDKVDFRAERVLTIDATQSAEAIARDILAKLRAA
jgi:thymidylate kinase